MVWDFQTVRVFFSYLAAVFKDLKSGEKPYFKGF